jgi:hypothetical protein
MILRWRQGLVGRHIPWLELVCEDCRTACNRLHGLLVKGAGKFRWAAAAGSGVQLIHVVVAGQAFSYSNRNLLAMPPNFPKTPAKCQDAPD